MPMYEFSCNKCAKRFEVLFRSMTERRKPVCPKCGSPNVRKLFSSFATRGTSAKGGNGSAGGGGCASCRGGSCATCGR